MRQKNWQQGDTMTHGNAAHEQPTTALDEKAITATDFVATVVDVTAMEPPDKQGSHWWSESTDGRCSEDAALFAASQPAPLSIV